jgi:hypothetical protein
MAAVNMSVSESPLVVSGNFYPAPSLLYGDRTEVRSLPVATDIAEFHPQPPPRDGKWNVVDRKFIFPTGLAFWGIVNCMPTEVDRRQIDELVQMLRQCCLSHGRLHSVPLLRRVC